MRRLKTARVEALWLEAMDRLYWTVDELMAFTGKSRRRIQMGLKRARNEPLEISTVWDIEWVYCANAFVEEHQCDWHGGANGTIPEDYPKGCLFCLKAGLTAMIARQGKPVEILKHSDDQPDGPAKFKPKMPKQKRKIAPRSSGSLSSPASGSGSDSP